MAYHALGREKESDATLRELIEKFHANAAWSIATVYALRNQRDEAFKCSTAPTPSMTAV